MIECGAVHVHRGAEGQHEAGDLLGNPHPLLAHFHGHRQGGTAGAGAEGGKLGQADAPGKFERAHAGQGAHHQRIEQQQDQQPQSGNHGILQQRNQDVDAEAAHRLGDQRQHPVRRGFDHQQHDLDHRIIDPIKKGDHRLGLLFGDQGEGNPGDD